MWWKKGAFDREWKIKVERDDREEKVEEWRGVREVVVKSMEIGEELEWRDSNTCITIIATTAQQESGLPEVI